MHDNPGFHGLYYRSWLATISGDLKWLLKLKRLFYRNLSFEQFRETRAKRFFWLRKPELDRVEEDEIIIEGRLINKRQSSFHAYMISNKYIHIQFIQDYYRVSLTDIPLSARAIPDVPREVINGLHLDYDLIRAIKMNLRGEDYFFRGWTYYDSVYVKIVCA
jgi:hypothetical protein